MWEHETWRHSSWCVCWRTVRRRRSRTTISSFDWSVALSIPIPDSEAVVASAKAWTRHNKKILSHQLRKLPIDRMAAGRVLNPDPRIQFCDGRFVGLIYGTDGFVFRGQLGSRMEVHFRSSRHLQQGRSAWKL